MKLFLKQITHVKFNWILILLCLLSACSHFQTPTVTPEQLSDTQSFPNIPQTWSQLETFTDQNHIIDPLDFTNQFSDELTTNTLQQLVQQMLQHNYQLQQIGTQITAAKAEIKINRADSRPQVTTDIDATRSKTVSSGISTQYAISANISWEIDLWQRLAQQVSASEANYEALVADYKAAQLSLTAQTIQAWFNLLTMQRQYTLNQENVATLKTTLQLVEDRYQGGLATLLEVRIARTSLASAESELLNIQQQVIGLQTQLWALLGPQTDQLKLDIDQDQHLPQQVKPLPKAVALTVIRQRPDIIAAERRWQGSHLQWIVAQKNRWPSLSLTGSLGGQSSEANDLFNESTLIWSLLGNLLQPIFNSGKLTALSDQAKANMQQQLYQYAELIHLSLLEIEQLLQQEVLLVAELNALKQVWHEAKATETLALQDYSHGLTDLTTLLDAQRTQITAHSQLLSKKNQWLHNRVELMLAFGGFGATDTQ